MPRVHHDHYHSPTQHFEDLADWLRREAENNRRGANFAPSEQSENICLAAAEKLDEAADIVERLYDLPPDRESLRRH